MFIAYVVIAVLLSLVLLFSAYSKLTRESSVTESMAKLAVPLGLLPFLATCEIAGALGLLAGIWVTPLAVAAAVGVVLYFVGAVGAHLRKADLKGTPPAAVLLVVSAAVLVLGIAAA
ncbi:DoxX family protein [Kitasatospora sp. NPDC002040]|uniref:DoxX family protein n=1 Tax=Kitasatospora sp. NPDC002040 TaxID=3154661 RepID=UPI0033298A46